MKRILLFVLMIGFGVSVFAQYRPIQKNRNVIGTQTTLATDIPVPGDKPANIYVSNKSIMEDPQVMMTNYDLMTNGAMGQARLYYWPSDNTMAATATWSQNETNSWATRGTGYNYYNGTAWGTPPTLRVESVRTGWPQIQPLGANGECLLSHQSATAQLVFSTRATKGTGTWTQTNIAQPTGASSMLWPRMLTTGADHMTIHIIALTAPTGNGGTTYNGMDGALLYCKSTNGGATWLPWEQLDGMTPSDYLAFSGDDYGWANPRGDTICFVVSSAFMDTFIMKSTDAGTTWTKTVIYNSPYNMTGVAGTSDLRFYTSDNTSAVALDKNGMAHVAFGLMADSISGSTSYNYWAYTQGLVYWNETMPMLPQEMNPDTLYNHGNLAGYVLDTMIYYQGTDALGLSYRACSLTAMPTMTIDDDNNLILAWTCPTVLLDASQFMFRHIFARTAKIEDNSAAVWNDNFYDLNSNFLYNFSECIWPSMAMKTSEDQFFLEFMEDDLVGSYLNSTNTGYTGQTGITDNFITVLSVDKPSVGVGINDQKKEVKPSFTVSKNYPNPVTDVTTVSINVQKTGNAILEVTNMMGQQIISMEKTNLSSGNYHFVIDASQLTPGIYFYTVKFNNESITNKMVVE
jgi:hypothetical protein